MAETKNDFAQLRQQMVRTDLQGRGISDKDVLKVMSEIRREEFISKSYQSQAYADGPLPIGCSQTISQPYIVALMSQKLQLNSKMEVLEIGTGSGYQTAILSKLAKWVYTIEKFNQLSESAQAVLGRMGVGNVDFFVGDGSCGWPEEKTFDRIIITAAAPKLPKPLIDQLVEGGKIIAPAGSKTVQQLMVYEKKQGKMIERSICDVRFVRLVGEHGFKE